MLQHIVNFKRIKEIYGILTTQLKHRVNFEVAWSETGIQWAWEAPQWVWLSHRKAKSKGGGDASMFERVYWRDRCFFLGGGGYRFDPSKPVKKATFSAVSVFTLCDETRTLFEEVENTFHKQEETIANSQFVQSVIEENSLSQGQEVKRLKKYEWPTCCYEWLPTGSRSSNRRNQRSLSVAFRQ